MQRAPTLARTDIITMLRGQNSLVLSRFDVKLSMQNVNTEIRRPHMRSRHIFLPARPICASMDNCILKTIGSSPCLRPAYRIDNKGFRTSIDKFRIPRKILEKHPTRRRNPAHGYLWYRSVARSASISCYRSGHTTTAVGCASPTARDLDGVSPMSDVLLPSTGEPASMSARLAHLGASRSAVAASAAIYVSRLPPPALGEE